MVAYVDADADAAQNLDLAVAYAYNSGMPKKNYVPVIELTRGQRSNLVLVFGLSLLEAYCLKVRVSISR